MGVAGAQRAHLEGHCGPTTPHQATLLHMQTHQSPTQANTRTASARRARPGSAALRRGAAQGTVGVAGAQRAHLEGRCGPTTPHQATPLHMQTHQSPTQANTCTASARRAQPGRAELRRGAVQGGLARSGHTLKATAGQARCARPRHCTRRNIRAPDVLRAPPRAPPRMNGGRLRGVTGGGSIKGRKCETKSHI